MPSQKTAWAVAAAAVATTLVSWAGGPPRAAATTPPTPAALGGMGGGGVSDPTPRVHVAAPVGPEAARAWVLLGRKVDVDFANETPLAEVLKFFREAGRDGKDGPGLSIYVDVASLHEVEKTQASPVTFEMKGVAISTALELILKQLGLVYHVRPDGLVVVNQPEGEADPMLRILDELSALREEVKALHPQPQPLPVGGSTGVR